MPRSRRWPHLIEDVVVPLAGVRVRYPALLEKVVVDVGTQDLPPLVKLEHRPLAKATGVVVEDRLDSRDAAEMEVSRSLTELKRSALHTGPRCTARRWEEGEGPG